MNKNILHFLDEFDVLIKQGQGGAELAGYVIPGVFLTGLWYTGKGLRGATHEILANMPRMIYGEMYKGYAKVPPSDILSKIVLQRDYASKAHDLEKIQINLLSAAFLPQIVKELERLEQKGK